MVRQQLERRGIRDPRVLQAMASIPRELFLPRDAAGRAYDDAPVPIGFGQTMSQPYMTATMAELLELRGDERVLEIGAGCGYAAAVLGSLAGSVYSIEVIPELAALARSNLQRAGCGSNVKIICGDGSQGYAGAMPYDAISVAAGAPEIPPALLDQLAENGRLVIPVGSREHQELKLLIKMHGEIESRVTTSCSFVPLVGAEGWR